MGVGAAGERTSSDLLGPPDLHAPPTSPQGDPSLRRSSISESARWDPALIFPAKFFRMREARSRWSERFAPKQFLGVTNGLSPPFRGADVYRRNPRSCDDRTRIGAAAVFY